MSFRPENFRGTHGRHPPLYDPYCDNSKSKRDGVRICPWARARWLECIRPIQPTRWTEKLISSSGSISRQG